jgi:thioredoxin reductase (NADPH)
MPVCGGFSRLIDFTFPYMEQDGGSFTALIIGGGPAGASCALWLKMLGYSPAIVEKSNALGGLQKSSPYLNRWLLGLTETTGEGFASKIHSQIQSLGIPVFFESVPELVEKKTGGSWSVGLTGARGPVKVQADFLVMATGVRPKACGFTANESVLIGPGKRIESHDFKGKRVAILGGGDNAFENFSMIRDKGAQHVRIFARSLRARQEFIGSTPPGLVSKGDYSASQETMRVNGESFDTLVVLYGWEPVNPMNGQVPLFLDMRGFINTDERRRTSNSRVYAIGEVTCKTHPCVATSMADGVICAKDIQQRLEERNRSFEQQEQLHLFYGT